MLIELLNGRQFRLGTLPLVVAMVGISFLLAHGMAKLITLLPNADWIAPSVIPPEAVAQEYMVGRLVRVAPSGESPDKKTATVLATVPQGPLMTCMLKLELTETGPMKINGAVAGFQRGMPRD